MAREVTVNVKLNMNGAETSISALEKKLTWLGTKKVSVPVDLKLTKDASSALKSQVSESKLIEDLQRQIQAAYDKASSEREKAAQQNAKSAMQEYQARAKVAEQEIDLQKRIQAEYDRISNERKASSQRDAQVAMQEYLARAKAAEQSASQEAKSIEKIQKAQAKLGQSYGTVSKEQASSISAMQQYIQSMAGMENASVKAIG